MNGDKNDIELHQMVLDQRVVKRKVRGARGIEYHLKTTVLGKPFKSWPNPTYVQCVLIPSRERKLIKKLCEELPVEEEPSQPGKAIIEYESSPMTSFAADLVADKGLAALNEIKRRRVSGKCVKWFVIIVTCR